MPRKQYFTYEDVQSIYNRIANGEHASKIAAEYNISRQRLHQIIGNIKHIKKKRIENRALYKRYKRLQQYLDEVHGIKTELELGKKKIFLVNDKGKKIKYTEKRDDFFYKYVGVITDADYLVVKIRDDYYILDIKKTASGKNYLYINEKRKNAFDILRN